MPPLRIAARTLARRRGFSAIAILSLGLAIALNVVIYSLLVALIDPPVDVRQPEQLHAFRFYGDIHHRLPAGAVESALSSGVTSFEGVTGYRSLVVGRESTIEYGGVERTVLPLVVRTNLFQVLGTHAVAGRTFLPSDSAAGAEATVLSDRLARRLFGDERSAVGRQVTVDGTRYVVIGVVPRVTVFPGLDTDVWLIPDVGVGHGALSKPVPLKLIRLRDGASPALVQHQLDLLAARLAAAAEESPRDTRMSFTQDKAERQLHLGGFHWALVAAVLAVLFVACGNLANLQLARGLARGSELAVRTALGATRADLIATLVLENSLLAVGGLVIGLVASVWGVTLVRATIPTEIAGYLVQPRVSWGMFVAALVAALLALVLVGLLPALRISRVDANVLLKSRAGTGANRKHRRSYSALLVVQLALALPLLCGAALLARSSWRFRNGEFVERYWIGYDPSHGVQATFTAVAPATGWVRVADVGSALVARLRALPSVSNAGVSVNMPPQGMALTVEKPNGEYRDAQAPMWSARVVTPAFFRAMGRTMSRGNDFAEGVYAASEVVMDEPTAHFLWPNENPIGKLVKFGNATSNAAWVRVVGTLHDMRDTVTLRYLDPDNGSHPGVVYRTMTSSDSVRAGTSGGVAFTVEVRARGDAERTATDVRHLLWATPGITDSYVRTLDDAFGLTMQRARGWFVALIFSIFAVLGTALVALGVFGIVSQSVAQRRQELGVRISLGATPRQIVRDVLSEGRLVALSGMAIGLYLTANTVHWVSAFLNGQFDTNDALLFAALALLLAATAFIAALGPALHATRIDPVEAMRAE